MSVATHTFSLHTKGFNDIHDITSQVKRAVTDARATNGIAVVLVPGSTAGITTIEFEPGVLGDLKKAIDRLVPRDLDYAHDARWGDGNGFSHVRAALLGASMSVPFINAELALGTWQQIVFIDFDNRPRTREVIVQIVGE